MNKTILTVAAILVALSSASCVNEAYDLEKVNKEVTVAENITLPIGETSRIRFEDFFVNDPETASSFSLMSDGTYKVFFKADEDLSGNLPSFGRIFRLEGASFTTEIECPVVAPAGTINVDVNWDMQIPLIKAGSFGKEILSIQNVEFIDTWLNFGMDFSGLPSTDSQKAPVIAVTVSLPEGITPSTLKFSGQIVNGKFTGAPVKIEKADLTGMDLSKDVILNAAASASIQGLSSDVAVSEKVSVVVSGGTDMLTIGRMDAKVDYSLNDYGKFIKLPVSSSSSAKMDATLALDNPYLMLDLSSNIGASAYVTAIMIPYKNGRPGDDVVYFTSKYEKAVSVDKTSHMKVFMARKDEGRPGDYQFVEGDIASLLKAGADSVYLTFSVATVKQEVSTLIPSADYKMSASYEVGASLVPDKDFKFSYCDTVGMQDIGELLNHAHVEIFGTIENGFPLKIEFEIIPLDENGLAIPLAKPARTEIESCNSDRSAKVSDYDFTISPADGHKITRAVLSFRLSGGSAAGVGINKDSYIKATMKMRLPEGMTYDLANSQSK